MKRRAFLGFLGGAAASGPKLAQDIAQVTARLPPEGGSVVGGVASASGDWKLSEITRLKSLLSGKSREARERDKVLRQAGAEMRERFRLDGLRSVSPASKARLLLEYQIEQDAIIRRYWWQRELDKLLG